MILGSDLSHFHKCNISRTGTSAFDKFEAKTRDSLWLAGQSENSEFDFRKMCGRWKLTNYWITALDGLLRWRLRYYSFERGTFFLTSLAAKVTKFTWSSRDGTIDGKVWAQKRSAEILGRRIMVSKSPKSLVKGAQNSARIFRPNFCSFAAKNWKK